MLLGKVTLVDDEAIQQQVTKKAIKLLHRADSGALFHHLRVTHSVSSIKEEKRRLFTEYAAPVTTVIRYHKHPFICFWCPCTMLLLAFVPHPLVYRSISPMCCCQDFTPSHQGPSPHRDLCLYYKAWVPGTFSFDFVYSGLRILEHNVQGMCLDRLWQRHSWKEAARHADALEMMLSLISTFQNLHMSCGAFKG